MSQKTLNKSVFAAVFLLVLLPACSAGNDVDDASASDAPSTQRSTEPSEGVAGRGANSSGGGDTDATGSDAESSAHSDTEDKSGGDGNGTVDPENAETQRSYDGLPKSGKQQSPVLSQIPGKKDASCVDTSGMRNARSGTIAAGPFDQVDESYGTKAPGKPQRSIRIYWIPMSSDPDGLTVQVSKADGGPSSTVRKGQASETEQWKFFDTNIPISEPGTWILRARSGANHGCFEVKVS